jgi:hypothetical protein
MRDVLGAAKQRIAREIDSHFAPTVKPIAADPWVISSLLQKSIRRGETDVAQRSALTFFRLKSSAIWRRLMVIAFEDIGIGSVEAVIETVAVSSDSNWRKCHGGDLRLALHLATVLAEAAKDRSADYLCEAKDHPGVAGFARPVATASLERRLSHVRDQALGLPQQAVAALFALGIGARGEISHGTSELNALLTAFSELGVSEELVAASSIAAARIREPITVMVPLIWLAAQASRETRISDFPVPSLVQMNDVPLYALDMHTGLGREAIWRFAQENKSVRACLARFVPENRWRSAAYVAAFYVDAAPIARRLVWDQSEALEAFGIGRDLLYAGIPVEGIQPLLEVMRANLGHLNEIRREVLSRSQPDLMARELRHD